MGHVLMESRHGLAVNAMLTHATGTAERDAALTMLGCMKGRRRITPGVPVSDPSISAAAASPSCRDQGSLHCRRSQKNSARPGSTTHHCPNLQESAHQSGV